MAIRVKFSDVDEFLAELVRDCGCVDRCIVRATMRWSMSRMIPVQHVTVVAGYVTGGTPVALEQYVGEYYRHGGEKSKDQAVELMAKIEAKVKELGLDCRAGVFEEEPK